MREVTDDGWHQVPSIHHPKVLTIVITDAHDAETVINLITHVQIFRRTSKPIRRGALSVRVSTAMQ